jgi:hypothetical protein
MSRGALEIMKYVARRFVAAGYPNRKVWTLPVPQERDPLYSELVTRGYLERFGTGTQNFIVSEKGVVWILEFTDSADFEVAPTEAPAMSKPEPEAPLTDEERRTVEYAKRNIEERLRDSHCPIGLDFSDERPIVQDEVFNQAVADGWRVERRGVWLNISRQV